VTFKASPWQFTATRPALLVLHCSNLISRACCKTVLPPQLPIRSPPPLREVVQTAGVRATRGGVTAAAIADLRAETLLASGVRHESGCKAQQSLVATVGLPQA
jgi:hypothetical protein